MNRSKIWTIPIVAALILLVGIGGFYVGKDAGLKEGFKDGQSFELEESWKKNRAKGLSEDFYVGGDFRGWTRQWVEFFYELENLVDNKLQQNKFTGSWGLRHGVDKKNKEVVMLVIASKDNSLIGGFPDNKIGLVEVVRMKEFMDREEKSRTSNYVKFDRTSELKELASRITENILRVTN